MKKQADNIKTTVIMLGTLSSDKMSDDFCKNNVTPQPADIVQKYIISALIKNEKIKNVKVISSPRIPCFPKVNLKKVESEDYEYCGAHIHVVGYCNIFETNFLFREVNYLQYIKRACKEFSNDNVLVLMYSLNSTFLKAALKIKKINRNAKVCSIIPDLPIYMDSYSGLKKIVKEMNIRLIAKLRKNIDKYVVYTKHIAKYLDIEEGKYIVVEGFVDETKVNINPIKVNNRKKICIYAGSLNPKYSIQKMIDVFDIYDDNVELHIYGNKNEANRYIYNKNVKYKGQVSFEEMRRIYEKSNLLLNPRSSSLELSKYSFPSKTFEYMASGKPVIMNKLPCLTEDYYNHILFFKDETIEGMRDSINKILSTSNDELYIFGKKAALFIKKNKNANVQVNRIIDFCNIE